MKKLLALAVGSASAVEVRLEAQDADGKNGTASQTVYELGVKQAINNNFAGDIVVKNYRTDGTNALATRYEAGVTAANTYGAFTPYARVALGEKYSSGSAGYGYYSVEPGVAASMGGGVTASLGYRFQDAFSNSQNDTTRTWRAKLGYDLTKSDNVYVGFDRQRGDSEQNITKIGYIHRF
jgi:hypothetical protein